MAVLRRRSEEDDERVASDLDEEEGEAIAAAAASEIIRESSPSLGSTIVDVRRDPTARVAAVAVLTVDVNVIM